jgi:hypothetical protein
MAVLSQGLPTRMYWARDTPGACMCVCVCEGGGMHHLWFGSHVKLQIYSAFRLYLHFNGCSTNWYKTDTLCSGCYDNTGIHVMTFTVPLSSNMFRQLMSFWELFLNISWYGHTGNILKYLHLYQVDRGHDCQRLYLEPQHNILQPKCHVSHYNGPSVTATKQHILLAVAMSFPVWSIVSSRY